MFDTREWADQHGETVMNRSQFDLEEDQERQLEHERAERLAEEYALERADRQYKVEFSADELDWLLDELLPMVAAYRKGYGDAPDIEHSIRQWRNQAIGQGYISSGLKDLER